MTFYFIYIYYMKINIKLLIIYIVILFISYCVYYNGKTYYKYRIDNNKCTPKIYDIGMIYIPDLSQNKILTIFVDIIPFVLPIIFFKNDTLLEFFKLSLYAMLLRSVFTHLTILPKIKKCDDSEFTLYNMIMGHCYDKIYSGHFVIIMLFALCALHAYPNINLLLTIISLIIYAIMIIATRSHYTIDIAVSVIISLLLFKYKNQL